MMGLPFVSCSSISGELGEAWGPVCGVSSLVGAKPVVPERWQWLQLSCKSNFNKSLLLKVDNVLTLSWIVGSMITTSFFRCWSGVAREGGFKDWVVGPVSLAWIIVTNSLDVSGNAWSGSFYTFLDAEIYASGELLPASIAPSPLYTSQGPILLPVESSPPYAYDPNGVVRLLQPDLDQMPC